MELAVHGGLCSAPLFVSQAVCCPDHLHCCPQGYTCDPKGGSCLQEGGTRLPWVRKTSALPREGQVTSGNVICDQTTSCPDGTTCCRMSLGTWGCCPLEQVWGALPMAMGVLGCPWKGGHGSMDPRWSTQLGDMGMSSRAQRLSVPFNSPMDGGVSCALRGQRTRFPFSQEGQGQMSPSLLLEG